MTSEYAHMLSTNRILISVALLATAVGCASVADTTRTGTIHEVTFGERMVPANLRVQPGDEVRWINGRSTSVTVEFLSGALDSVSCEKGFSIRGFGNLRGRLQESTTIEPNGSASLCFENLGTISYNARMESAVAGGQQIEQGTIRVVSR
jgi:plastocyanin